MSEDNNARHVDTVTGETAALLECLKLYAPGVKWTVELASRFRGSLYKRGYTIEFSVEKEP